MNRKDFLKAAITMPFLGISGMNAFGEKSDALIHNNAQGEFYKRLTPLHRLLEMDGWYVWGNSPIIDEEGKVHLFFSRWPAAAGWRSWLSKCEIGHAIADRPEGPYEFIGTALEPSGPGLWDAFTCHNPTIHKVGDKYALFYIGSSDGTSGNKSIGLALADSLYGPWQKRTTPLIRRGNQNSFDDRMVSNPAFLQHPNGQFWLYYKAASEKSYQKGNNFYALAVADRLTGPYRKVNENPVIDLSYKGENVRLEDAYAFIEDGVYKLVTRDMGYFDNYGGLYFESRDGIKWSKPQRAFFGAEYYGLQHEERADHLFRKNRIERPQILMQGGRPTYLFTSMQGGKYNLSTSFLFKID